MPLRIGIFAVDKYPNGAGCNLQHCVAQATDFVTELKKDIAPQIIDRMNEAATDSQFERHNKGPFLSGEDSFFVNSCDIAYFSGHGSEDGLIFGTSNADNGLASASECSWGGNTGPQVGRLKWLIADACRLLMNTSVNKNKWATCFDGLRILLGFATVTNDQPDRGRRFATYLRAVTATGGPAYAILESWRFACEETATPAIEYAWLAVNRPGGPDTLGDRWGQALTTVPGTIQSADLHYHHGPC